MKIEFNIGWNFGGYGGSNDFLVKEWKVSKNRFLELQITRFSRQFTLLGFKCAYYPRTDHTPFNLELAILNIEFLFTLYDHRHWNFKENRYYLPGEEEND